MGLSLSSTVLAQTESAKPADEDAVAVAPLANHADHPNSLDKLRILVRGIRVVGVDDHRDVGITPESIQGLADAAYAKLKPDSGEAPRLNVPQVADIADQIAARYREAGFKSVIVFLPGLFESKDNIVEISVAEGELDEVAAAPVRETLSSSVVPPMRERPTEKGTKARLAVSGFVVTGVGEHLKSGVTPARAQAVADADYAKLAGASDKAPELSLDQLQEVADDITKFYKNSGFIVARAIVPSQTLGPDQKVQIQVLEGQLGKVIVKGAKRYRPSVVAAPAERLKGAPLLKDDVDSALLYIRDLPGDTVSATFQPGSRTGDTDLVVVTNEAPRPYSISVGGNDYGTEFTGRYRAQLGLTYNGLLGLGDQFVGKGEYALDPSNNVFGTVGYRIPTVVVPGLSGTVGADRNELHINSGPFASADVKGPTTVYYGGPDWKFVNSVDLQLQSSFLLIDERSKLTSATGQLADEQFVVALLKFDLNRTDRRFHGVDIVEAGIRKSLHDATDSEDQISPLHAHDFTVGTFSYTRLQFVTSSQRVYAKISGQYTDDALIPLEQFVIGGPDSVRAYPIADALRDRGFYGSLEYHVDAPGFGDVASPFYGRPWRELLELEAFVDAAKGYSAGANKTSDQPSNGLSGIGGGFIFRIPKFYQFQFHLDGSAPLSNQKASNGADFHVYGLFSLTY